MVPANRDAAALAAGFNTSALGVSRAQILGDDSLHGLSWFLVGCDRLVPDSYRDSISQTMTAMPASVMRLPTISLVV